MFDCMFQFEHAVNAHVPGRGYLPRGYGQLGCSGFIVVDANGNFVSRKTLAFLQHGEMAFRHVEELLEQQLDSEKLVTEEEKEENGEQTQQDTTKTEAAVENYLPPLIGIASMDDEHERCAEALHTLAVSPTRDNLQAVLKELEHHFAHEEAVMIQHGFGGDADSPFSALTSHVKDHQRILDLARTELKRHDDVSAALVSTFCSLKDNSNKTQV